MHTKSICICKRCEHRNECGYYEEVTEPIISAVRASYYLEQADTFISTVYDALKNFTCQEFEEEVD